MGLRDLSATEQIAELAAGRVSSLELVDAHLDAIARDDVDAFLAVDAEGARARAREIDALPERPPLGGIPLGVKDALSTRGIVTTSGSKMLEGFRPVYTATCVARLEQAGARECPEQWREDRRQHRNESAEDVARRNFSSRSRA